MPVTLNASTSSGLIATSDTSGNIELQNNGTTRLTVNSSGVNFAAQPLIAGVAPPAFSANANTTQSISSGTFTKVVFGAERFDTNNNFASNTFTPTVAGYYQLNISVYYASNPSGQAILFLYKNGAAYTEIGRNVASGAGTLSGSVVAYANGSTDYFDVYFLSSGAGNTLSNSTDAFYVNFSGVLVRGA